MRCIVIHISRQPAVSMSFNGTPPTLRFSYANYRGYVPPPVPSLCPRLRLSSAHSVSCCLSAVSQSAHCFADGLLLVTSADKEIVRNASFVVGTSIRTWLDGDESWIQISINRIVCSG